MSIQNASPSTSFATAFGGGLDYRIVRAVASRFQADYCGLTFLRRASGQCPGIDRHRFPFLMKD